MHRRSILVVIGFVAACETAQSDAPKPDTREPKTSESEVREPEQVEQVEPEPPGDPNTCTPGGLEGASKLETIVLPRECQVVAPGTLMMPTIVRNETELAAAITCEPGTSLPAIDFTKNQLQVANFMLSPAYGGSELFDDGKTVTYVQRDRSPCPDDPLPMPIGSSIAYLLPQGAERAMAQRSCTLPPQCD